MRTFVVCAASVLFVGAIGLATGARGQQQPDRPLPPPGPHEERKATPPVGQTPPSEMKRPSGQVQDGMQGRESMPKKDRMRAKARMNRGGSSQNVRQAQQSLKSAGFDPGPTDGVLGPNTRRALREYQGSKGLKATGTLNQKTRQALMAGTPGSPPRSDAPSGSPPGGGSPPSGSPSGTPPGGATPTPSTPRGGQPRGN